MLRATAMSAGYMSGSKHMTPIRIHSSGPSDSKDLHLSVLDVNLDEVDEVVVGQDRLDRERTTLALLADDALLDQQGSQLQQHVPLCGL